VSLKVPVEEDVAILQELVGGYADTLAASGQDDAASDARHLLDDPATSFRVVRPGADIVEQTISTE
jgi:hypothetical protein